MGAIAMSRLPESGNYLMKCLGVVLLLGLISLGTIGGCGNNTADEPDPIDDFLNIVKTLKVEIASEDLAMLQEEGLKLNIAIKVNDTFNVVWLSNSDYRETNTYQWSPIFHLFTGFPFKEGDQVFLKVAATSTNVALGQKVTFDPNGDITVDEGAPGAPADSISITNNSDITLHAGLSQQLTSPDITIEEKNLPTFVNPDSFEPDTIEAPLTPMDEVMVWFEDTETGTMFSDAPPNAFIGDLAEADMLIVLFSNGEWSVQMM